MSKYHVNHNGETGRCGAEQGQCPFGGDSGEERHFNTPEEAQAFAEQENKSKYGATKTLVKKESFTTPQQLIQQSGTTFDDEGNIASLERKLDENTTFYYQKENNGSSARVEETINGENKTTIYRYDRNSELERIDIVDNTIGYPGHYSISYAPDKSIVNISYLKKGSITPKTLKPNTVTKRIPNSPLNNWDRQAEFDNIQQHITTQNLKQSAAEKEFYPREEYYNVADTNFAKKFQEYSGYRPVGIYSNYETLSEYGEFTPISNDGEEEGFVNHFEVETEEGETISIEQKHSISSYDEEYDGYWVMTQELLHNQDTGDSEDLYVGDTNTVYKTKEEAQEALNKMVSNNPFRPSDYIEHLDNYTNF